MTLIAEPHAPLATVYPEGAERPSLVIVGTGSYARYLVQTALDKHIPIVGAFKRAGAKVGSDFGTAIGLEKPLGIIVEDMDAIRPGEALSEIALVAAGTTLKDNLDTYRRLMEGGYNVLCLAGEAFHPFFYDPATAAEIDVIAKRNGVTFTGGGIWDMSRVWSGILTVGPCTKISRLVHQSVTDVGRQLQSAEEAARYKIPVGITLEAFHAGDYSASPTSLLYPSIAAHVMEAVGYTPMCFTTRVEPILAEKPMKSWLFPDPIPTGFCIGARTICAMTTAEGVTVQTEVDLRLCEPGDEEFMQWSVEGVPSVTTRVIRNDSIAVTVTSLFNRFPDVIAAPPGIVPISLMGPLKHMALA